jgi:hypothetical protein
MPTLNLIHSFKPILNIRALQESVIQSAKAPNGARCQCDPQCKEPPLEKFPFCAFHKKNRCSRIAPVSKDTPKYNPTRWNKHEGIRGSLNCFAYAFHNTVLPKDCTNESCNASFHQPGIKSGHPRWSDVDGKRCPDLFARIMGDIPEVRLTTFIDKCPKGFRKIAVVVDPNEDYHFYRQDADGYWSHKPGATPVTRLDTTGRPIYDPMLATRDNKSSNLNYERFCGYLLVPVTKNIRLSRSGGKRQSVDKRRSVKRRTVDKRRTVNKNRI